MATRRFTKRFSRATKPAQTRVAARGDDAPLEPRVVGAGRHRARTLSGNTEVTLIGGDDDAIGARAGTFAPNAPEATCRFVFGSDAPLGPRAVETRATVAPDGKSAFCVSPPRPVGIANDVSPTNAITNATTNAPTNASSADYPPIATHDFGSPCFFASVALSNDGVTFSEVSTAFLYCDTHVAPLGERVHAELAYGTPSRPFPNLRSAFAASLAGARRDERSRVVNRDARGSRRERRRRGTSSCMWRTTKSGRARCRG